MQLFSNCWEASAGPCAPHASIVVDLDEVYATIAGFESLYPGFREWFFAKVVPSSSDQRAIFIAKANSEILGLAIAKREVTERKLCTLWTAPTARGNCIAQALADQAFEWLSTRRPLFTVPEERISEFRGLLKRWEFDRVETVVGYYRPDKVEYVFNGGLQPDSLS